MKLKEQIKKILEENIECRNSDNKLILEYIKRYYPNCYHESILSILFRVLTNYRFINWDLLIENNICLESITRARRQLQKLHPELQATNKVKRCRKKKEGEYRQEYSTNKAFTGMFGNIQEKINNLLK